MSTTPTPAQLASAVNAAASFTVAVAGNPNSGKTTLFNALTGANQKVGNYPGVTVEKKEGLRRFGEQTIRFVDLPGTYSLTTFSLDEVVARNYVLEEQPDLLLDVVDAANLERNLYLAIQLAELGTPMVMALNMHDVAEQRGIRIDAAKLSAALGIPVVPTVGSRKEGVEALLHAVVAVGTGGQAAVPRRFHYGPLLEPALERLRQQLGADAQVAAGPLVHWFALKLLERDPRAAEALRRLTPQAEAHLAAAASLVSELEGAAEDDLPTLLAEQRYALAAEVMRQAVIHTRQGATLTDRIDAVICHRVFGLVSVAVAVYVTFALTFQLADGWAWVPWPGGWQTPCGVLGWFFSDFLLARLEWLGEGPLRSLLVDGIIGGVGGVMGFVPIIFFMFLMLALIEDSGYVARIAFVLDRLLRAFGLQGKAILAMIVSGGIAGGCAVPGVMATRTLNDPRDRLTTMLVAPFMNCGAKIPVFAMLIAAFFAAHKGLMMWALVVTAWTVALLAALGLRKSILRGADSPFVMELPPYHLPGAGSVLRHAWQRSWSYLRKAGTVILAVSVVLWAMMYFPRVDRAPYEAQRAAAVATLTAATGAAELVTGEALAATLAFAERCEAAGEDLPAHRTLQAEDPARYALVSGAASGPALAAFREQLAEVDRQEAAAQLQGSIAGSIGRALEPISRFAGFDWRDNIALTGGFAAKEVIVSTMGTAYSMGAVEPVEDVTENASGNPLARQISQDPAWTPLRALALILFVMFYSPCLVTTSVIWRESGHWKWALFASAYSTIIAFTLAVAVYRIGHLLGFGLN